MSREAAGRVQQEGTQGPGAKAEGVAGLLGLQVVTQMLSQANVAGVQSTLL